jgi:hypothetical protein
VFETCLFGFVLDSCKQRGHLADEPSQHPTHRGKILQPHPFGSRAELIVLLLLFGGGQGPQKQAGIGGHLVTLRRVGLLIVLIPQVQIPGAQRLFAVRFEQLLRMGAVGARQRRHVPARRPRGDLASLDRLQGKSVNKASLRLTQLTSRPVCCVTSRCEQPN